mgnify:CR=1 FL=1
MKKIISCAPGRICLFGDHQDYIQLPVIACAIDRLMQIDAVENGENYFKVEMPDLDKKKIIPLKQNFDQIQRGDLLNIALKVLHTKNIIPDRGFHVLITSQVPINAGLSSSSALTIAWIQFLITAFSTEKISPKELALLAYESEVVQQGSSGGKMDQFTIAIGDTIFLDTHTDRVQKFNDIDLDLVVGVSGLSKDTFGTLSHLKSNAWKAIDQVKAQIPEFDIALTTVNELNKNLTLVETSLKPFFYAAVCNHDITQRALKILEQEQINTQLLGELMNKHHHLLKSYLKITPPLMDKMIDAANDSGALGSKIVGSGGGGCMVAIVKDQYQKQIIEAIKASGAEDAFAVNITKGATFK